METIIIKPSNKKDKKYEAVVGKKHIHFGYKPMQDYTQHHSETRKNNYINRHASREDWTKNGIKTAGFYSRWITWNKPTIQASINDLNSKYKNIKFKYEK